MASPEAPQSDREVLLHNFDLLALTEETWPSAEKLSCDLNANMQATNMHTHAHLHNAVMIYTTAFKSTTVHVT